jgi:TolB-like protein/tetratricopeptide (TPR) repeat protein
VLLAVAAVAFGAAAAPKPVLMVIYFDNLTGKPEHDVMKKGLADMIITDLIAYDGVTVVERDKLEAVLDELRLQRTRAFDPATRAKIGKQVGARYLISGSMISVSPEVRIDARLTDITSGVDVTAASVRGTPDHLFDLEHDLVGKLTAAIDAKLSDSAASRKMKGVDVETMLAYSRGLDLEDAGKLEDARKQYSEVLKKKPTFTLPRERTELLIKKLASAQTSRGAALSSDALTLGKAADQALAANFDQLSDEKQREYLELRIVRGRLIARMLQDHLVAKSWPMVVVKGHEGAALKLLREIEGNYDLLRQELARYYRQHGDHAWPSLRLPEDLSRIAREAQLLSSSSDSADEPRILRRWCQFALLGKVDPGEHDFLIGPALGDLDPRVAAAAFAALDRGVASLLQRNKTGAEHDVEQHLELWADALFRLGKTEESVAKLQRFLDEYPTSTGFSRVTRKINVELGVEHTADMDDLLKYPDKGLKQCDYFALARGWSVVIHRRISVKGPAALAETVGEIERACGTQKLYWNDLYSMMALSAAGYGDCELSHQLWRKYLAHNGSRADFDGWQKWHPDCAFVP